MSEVRVNKLSPRSGTTVTLGDSGDTITIPSGVTLANSGTFTNFQSTGIDDNATSTAITIDSSQNVDVAGNIKFADNGRAVFGAGSDLQIWHTGSHSYIMDSGTGNLYLQGSSNIRFQNPNNITLMNIADNGDISFYEDTGTTPKLFWDASAERLGIGTSSPIGKFHIQSSSSNHIYLNGTSGDAYGLWVTDTGTNFTLGTWSGQETIRIDGNGNTIQFETGNSERMRIDSSGNVGIGVIPQNNWTGTSDALQVGNSGALFTGASSNYVYLSSNIVFDGTNFRYINSDEASYYLQNTSGEHIFANAASGTAGNSFSPVERMRINSSGNVGIGTTSPSAKLEVISNAGTSEGNFKLAGYVQTTKGVALTTSLQDLLQVGNRASFKITGAVADASGGGVSGYTIAYVSCSNDYATQGNIDTVGLSGTIVFSWKATSGTSADAHTLQVRTTSGSTNQLFVVVETFGGAYASGGSGTGNGQFQFLL